MSSVITGAAKARYTIFIAGHTSIDLPRRSIEVTPTGHITGTRPIACFLELMPATDICLTTAIGRAD